MNLNQVIFILGKSATELGYTPTIYALRHDALHRHSLPLLAIKPPVLVALDGEKRVEEEYDVEVIFMRDSGVGDDDRNAAFDSVVADIAPYVAALMLHPQVLSVSNLVAKPLLRPLTVAGEAAVSLKMNVRLLADCK